ncbi:hypothetical protein ACOME3_005820 [Neoechinorhynchus agilis]
MHVPSSHNSTVFHAWTLEQEMALCYYVSELGGECNFASVSKNMRRRFPDCDEKHFSAQQCGFRYAKLVEKYDCHIKNSSHKGDSVALVLESRLTFETMADARARMIRDLFVLKRLEQCIVSMWFKPNGWGGNEVDESCLCGRIVPIWSHEYVLEKEAEFPIVKVDSVADEPMERDVIIGDCANQLNQDIADQGDVEDVISEIKILESRFFLEFDDQSSEHSSIDRLDFFSQTLLRLSRISLIEHVDCKIDLLKIADKVLKRKPSEQQFSRESKIIKVFLVDRERQTNRVPSTKRKRLKYGPSTNKNGTQPPIVPHYTPQLEDFVEGAGLVDNIVPNNLAFRSMVFPHKTNAYDNIILYSSDQSMTQFLLCALQLITENISQNCTRELCRSYVFVPFGVETLGALGSSALRFKKELCRIDSRARQEIQELVPSCAKTLCGRDRKQGNALSVVVIAEGRAMPLLRGR